MPGSAATARLAASTNCWVPTTCWPCASAEPVFTRIHAAHVSLPALDDAGLAAELAGSRATLSNLLGEIDGYLAYPYGHVDDRVESATRAAGYRAGFSVQPGFNRRHVNPFRIRRLDVCGTDTPAMLLRKMRLGSNDGSLRAAVRYYWARMAGRVGGRGS